MTVLKNGAEVIHENLAFDSLLIYHQTENAALVIRRIIQMAVLSSRVKFNQPQLFYEMKETTRGRAYFAVYAKDT